MVKRVYTTFQLLRYPLVFGGCLAAYFTAFSYRKVFFKDELEEVKQKNEEQNRLDEAKFKTRKAS